MQDQKTETHSLHETSGAEKNAAQGETGGGGPCSKRIAILFSGRGSNLEAIVQACQREGWGTLHALSDRPHAQGLARAAQLGIPTQVIDAAQWGASFESELMKALDRIQPDVIALAGFMRILSAPFVAHYCSKLLNIHPSVLPAFPGLSTHRRAIEAGALLHGATVHFVEAQVDTGPIVAQAILRIRPDDDERSLAERVLRYEHKIYPLALRWFLEGRLSVVRRSVVLLNPRLSETQVLFEGMVN